MHTKDLGPGALLLITGGLIGLNFPLGKLAGNAGAGPVVWAAVVSLGALVAIAPGLARHRRLGRPGRKVAGYALISGLISFAGVNLLLFAVIPHVGAAVAGLMFALSPVATLAVARGFGLASPGRAGLIGLVLGLAGAALVALTKGGAATGGGLWMLAAASLPLVLAAGNVYRSLAWPEGASPDLLAFWSHAAALAAYGLLFVWSGGIGLAALTEIPWLTLAQMLAAGAAFRAYFRLQARGGPVMLSQIGYVAAGVGLVAGVLVFGEPFGPMSWAGAALIAAGLGFTLADNARTAALARPATPRIAPATDRSRTCSKAAPTST